MRPYEIAVIFDVDTEEQVIRETIDRVAATVREQGGTPGHVERWGRRAFAYEVKHRSEGYYVFVEVVADPPAVMEVGRMLALSDEVLRHRVIRQPDQRPARPASVASASVAPASVAPAQNGSSAPAPVPAAASDESEPGSAG